VQEYPPIEAEKFFNYFESNGWFVSGKTKMKDWQSARLQLDTQHGQVQQLIPPPCKALKKIMESHSKAVTLSLSKGDPIIANEQPVNQ
jgi:hypothetical protein